MSSASPVTVGLAAVALAAGSALWLCRNPLSSAQPAAGVPLAAAQDHPSRPPAAAPAVPSAAVPAGGGAAAAVEVAALREELAAIR